MFDIRALTGVGLGLRVATYSDQGGVFCVITPWQGLVARSEIHRTCAQISGATVFWYVHADAIFQRLACQAQRAGIHFRNAVTGGRAAHAVLGAFSDTDKMSYGSNAAGTGFFDWSPQDGILHVKVFPYAGR